MTGHSHHSSKATDTDSWIGLVELSSPSQSLSHRSSLWTLLVRLRSCRQFHGVLEDAGVEECRGVLLRVGSGDIPHNLRDGAVREAVHRANLNLTELAGLPQGLDLFADCLRDDSETGWLVSLATVVTLLDGF